MHTIVLDTSFLVDAVKFKVDLFSEFERICDFHYEIAIIDKTLDELKGKPGEKLIKEIIKKKEVHIMQTDHGKYVDDILLGLKQKDLIIATQDKNLKRRLKVPIITIRQKKYLILNGIRGN